MSLKYGISFPNFGGFGDLDALRGLARDAEAVGWDGFFLWDHINIARDPTLDPWVALAAIAIDTERMRIGTMITPLPRRRPWIVARQAVTLDHLSHGRLILGVGLGHPPNREYASLGEDPGDRVRAEKLDEALAIIDGLWRGERFSFAGKHYRIDHATFLPRPVQQPRIPIWVAGMWPARAPFRRAARWDGAFPIRSDLNLLSLEELRDVAAYLGRQPKDSGSFDLVVSGRLPADPAPWVEAGVTWWLEGALNLEGARTVIRKGPPAR